MALLKGYEIDERVTYPRTEREARELIAQTFADNNWDELEQEVFLHCLDIRTAPDKLDRDEMKKVLSELAKDKMILFAV